MITSRWNCRAALLTSASAFLIGGLSLAPGRAVAADDAPPPQAAALSEIVVTAQRREQQLQSVPIAISAFTAAKLATSGVNSADQLATVTPGMQMIQSRNAITPYLRGVGMQNAGIGAEASIATYVDGVYYASLSGNLFSFNNIERVEVLRGPQGTFFGRNASGGLIQVITRTPSTEPRAILQAGYGNYETATASFYGTTGLAENVAADLALYYYDQNKGWGRNIVTGQEVNVRSDKAIRSKILWNVTDAFSATLSADWSKTNSDMGVIRQVSSDTLARDGLSRVGSIYDTRSNTTTDNFSRQYGASLVLRYETALGDLTSTTAGRKYHTYNFFDQDSTPALIISAPITENSETFQQEVFLSGSNERLDYTTGVFYFFSRSSFDPQQIISSSPTQNSAVFGVQKVHSYAAFGQGTFHLTDTTRVTAGLRYTADHRSAGGYRIATAPHPSAGAILATTATLPTSQTRRKFDKLTWRFSVEQDLAPDVLGYVSVNRGFKSGLYTTSNPFAVPVNPEVLDAYAAGVKSEWLDHTVRLNVEIFHYNYKDIQLTANPAGTTILYNAASGKVDGLDVDAAWAPQVPVGRLEISAAASFLRAKYGSFPNAIGFIPFPGTPIPAGFTACGAAPVGGGARQCIIDATGNPMIRSPKMTSTVAIDYSFPIGAGNLGFNGSWYHNSGFSWEPQNLYRQAAHDVFTAQVSLTTDDWTFRVYGRNLTKEQYFSQMSVGTFGNSAQPAAPRTYGFSIERQF